MKDIIENIFGFLYALSMGDYIFLTCTFILILLFIYIIYLIKKDNEDSISSNELAEIKNKIEQEYKPTNIVLTEYEQEQEDTAIISYEELIKSKDNIKMSYDEEYKPITEEISIKKINLNSDINELKPEKIEVKLMDYKNYEDFLKALKQLQINLSK